MANFILLDHQYKQSATFGKRFDLVQLSITNIPKSYQISKLPTNDILAKYELCAFLGIVDKTLHHSIFSLCCDFAVIPNSFKIFQSKCTDDVFSILPKSPTLHNCHVYISRYIYRYLSVTLTH